MNLKKQETIYDRGSKVRMRMMGWMREPYEWWIIHTDCMAVQSPQFDLTTFQVWFGHYNMSFGIDYQANEATGPPTD